MDLPNTVGTYSLGKESVVYEIRRQDYICAHMNIGHMKFAVFSNSVTECAHTTYLADSTISNDDHFHAFHAFVFL